MRDWGHIFLAHVVLAFGAVSGFILLPALLVCHQFQEAFFAFIYKLCLKVWGVDFDRARRAVLARLDGLASHDSSLKSRGVVRLLEVGAAHGPNLKFMQRPVEYWKVEPNTAFNATFEANLAANRKVTMERSVIGYGEDMSMLPDGHFDAVLFTYVLCSAKDGTKLVSECKRVLAKGGVLLFSEHVAHPKNSVSRCLQDFFMPFARNLTCGCHINRESADVIKGAGFACVEIDELVLDIPFSYNRHIFGVAKH